METRRQFIKLLAITPTALFIPKETAANLPEPRLKLGEKYLIKYGFFRGFDEPDENIHEIRIVGIEWNLKNRNYWYKTELLCKCCDYITNSENYLDEDDLKHLEVFVRL